MGPEGRPTRACTPGRTGACRGQVRVRKEAQPAEYSDGRIQADLPAPTLEKQRPRSRMTPPGFAAREVDAGCPIGLIGRLRRGPRGVRRSRTTEVSPGRPFSFQGGIAEIRGRMFLGSKTGFRSRDEAWRDRETAAPGTIRTASRRTSTGRSGGCCPSRCTPPRAAAR